MALGAKAAHFQNSVPYMEAFRRRRLGDSCQRIRRFGFGDALAILAQKYDGLRRAPVLAEASEEGVARFKAVNKPRALQHLQDAINGNWCEPLALGREIFDQIIGADRLVSSWRSFGRPAREVPSILRHAQRISAARVQAPRPDMHHGRVHAPERKACSARTCI